MTSTVRFGLTAQRISTRAFHTSRARLSGHGPHYPEGPKHNLPWTPKGKWNIRIKLFSFFGTTAASIDGGLIV
jgi:Cytochrome c oxidase subunit VIIc